MSTIERQWKQSGLLREEKLQGRRSLAHGETAHDFVKEFALPKIRKWIGLDDEVTQRRSQEEALEDIQGLV
jgi:hypothetical protein